MNITFELNILNNDNNQPVFIEYYTARCNFKVIFTRLHHLKLSYSVDSFFDIVIKNLFKNVMIHLKIWFSPWNVFFYYFTSLNIWWLITRCSAWSLKRISWFLRFRHWLFIRFGWLWMSDRTIFRLFGEQKYLQIKNCY